ncbi:MAG: phage tail protein [Plesiomonas shigelloides]
MNIFLTEAFEQWVAQCAINNTPARPDAVFFAHMGRNPTLADTLPPDENITCRITPLQYGRLNSNAIVCSATVEDNAPAFTYDWICLVHTPSNTLCAVIKTPERHKLAGETLIRNFVISYNGIAKSAVINTPPQSWQLDITAWLQSMTNQRRETLQDFYGHHVFIGDAGLVSFVQSESKYRSAAGIAYLGGLRVLLTEQTLDTPAAEQVLYLKAWVDGHHPDGMAIIAHQLYYGDSEQGDHLSPEGMWCTVAPVASFNGAVETVTDLRVTSFSLMDAINDMQEHASAAKEHAEQAQSSAQISTEQAGDAARSAEEARSAAEKTNEVLKGALKTDNKLSEIAKEGESAQNSARKNLGLGTAATQRVQTSKYDKGRESVALAGSFGFGGYLENKDVITFTEQNTLLGWIKHAAPGRYLVRQSGIQIVPGFNFAYVTLEVIQGHVYNNSPTDKILRLYSPSDVYTCAFSSYTGVGGSSDPGRLSNWKKTSPESLLDVLRSASGEWGDPGVGGLILAAYQGKELGDTNIKLARGQTVSGSRLGQVGIETGFGGSTYASTPRTYVANCTAYPLPGAYMALSGVPTATGDRAWIGLFMRYA